MFAAFAKGFGDGQRGHDQVRAMAIMWMREHPQDFIPFVPDSYKGQSQDFNCYLLRMSQLGEWGDNLTLQAMCKAYRTHVHVLKRGQKGDLVWMEIGDRVKPQSVFWLYLDKYHYENLLDRSQISFST
ncbi:hypothetical protein BCR39DRAFT_473602 [Naematelia encephala]|uniref:OTU domain-containing protein n=1 Tax=Naematelia encephala TaxID=71784 RepID=A0A1Y2AKT6_9TREE|nr:hypothetical protein BCR39DRAFT_473602 [Naematelia encephala]